MQENITRKDIAKAMQKKFKLPKKYCEETVNGVFENISKAINEDKTVSIRGFGSFKAKLKKEHVKTSAFTGKKHTIKAKKSCSFYAYNRLKDIVKS